MGIIISSFTGCGRSYFKNVYGKQVKIYDAVEILDKNDLETYLNTVLNETSKHDIVFIDFSNDVRSVFEENNIENDESPNCYKHKLENKGEFLGNTPLIMQYINNIKEKP